MIIRVENRNCKKYLIIVGITFIISVIIGLKLAYKDTNLPQISAGNSEVETIYQREYSIITSTTKYSVDDVKKWSSLLGKNNRWEDIDYTFDSSTVKAYSPQEHLKRIRYMALAYVDSGGELYKDEKLLKVISSALDDNIRRSHEETFSWNNDWYATYIACPDIYSDILILIRDYATKDNLKRYSKHLRDGLEVKNSNGRMQFENGGENLVWVAGISIKKGCIEDDLDTIKKGFEYIASTLAYNDAIKGEGIKRDGTFHQHDAQVYSGGYGLWYTSDIVNYMQLAKETSFLKAFSDDKIALFNDTLLDGYQWFSYRNNIDFQTTGRNISRNGGTKNISVGVLDAVSALFPNCADRYNSWKLNISVYGRSKLIGNKYFWQSDMMAQRGSNYYMSVKVASIRTNGTETMNNENIKGFNLPLGTTNISSSGNEYNNIYPLWDWSRIPGTTTEYGVTYESQHTFQGANEVAGGVSSGVNGIIAFSSKYRDIASNKAYFCLDNMMYCVGNGITADKKNDVITSINQCFENGMIIFDEEEPEELKDRKVTSSKIKWIYHDNIGYIFPKKMDVILEAKKQSGSWKSINTLFGSDETLNGDILSVWINHGKKPDNASYEYIIAPDITRQECVDYSTEQSMKCAYNTKDVQVVVNSKKGVYGAVFYKEGEVELESGFTLSVDKPCIVLIEAENSRYKISVSSILHKKEDVKLTLSKKLQRRVVNENVNIVNAADKSTLTYSLPGDYNAGKSLTGEFILIRDEIKNTVHTEKPITSETIKPIVTPEPVVIKTEEPLPVITVKPNATEPTDNALRTPQPVLGTVARVYKHINYGGYEVELTQGRYTLNRLLELGMLDNDISSVKVTPGYKIILIDGDNFTGNALEIITDDASIVNEGFNDIVSSIRVEKIIN